MPLWWGTNVPKVKRQKLNGSWADDTTYTPGHTYDFTDTANVNIVAQLNLFKPEERRVIRLQDGTLKIYRPGSGSNNWRGEFLLDWIAITNNKAFFDYFNDLYNNVSATIRYVVIPKPGVTATQEGMTSPSTFVIVPAPGKAWDFEYLRTSEGSDLWTLGQRGRFEFMAVSLSQIPESGTTSPSDPT